MKILLIIITLFQFCFTFGQTFGVTNKNIELDIKELIKPATKVELTHAVKYKGEFYCFFEEVKKDNLSRDIKFCFVFSDTSKNLKKIEVPTAIQNTVYYDLFVKDDKVFVKTYMDSETFCFDIHKSKWVKKKNAADLIFEDEKFYVYSLDFGEWGGKTWFKDKKTELEYEIEVTTPLVNKIETTYYLTTWYGKQIGFEIVYKDTTTRDYFDYSYRPYIVSSFVWQNELLHIYETDTVTYIAKTENNKIKTIQKIGNKLSFYDWHYSYRSKIQTDGRQLLKFKTNNKFGLIEINGLDINTYNLILK